MNDDERAEREFEKSKVMYRRHRASNRLWISTGAALGLIAIAIGLVLLTFFYIAPTRRTAADAQTQAIALRAAQRQSARNGARLLHQFDCTYGRAILETIREAERSRATDAEVALEQRRVFLESNRRQLADAQLRQADADRLTAERYGRLHRSLVALGPSDGAGRPTPAC